MSTDTVTKVYEGLPVYHRQGQNQSTYCHTPRDVNLYTNSVPTFQKTQALLIIKTNHLMLYRDKNLTSSLAHTQHVST